MGSLYRALARPALFRLDPEDAHGASIRALELLGALPGIAGWLRREVFDAPQARPVELFGVRFPNAVGLAAGYDKDGRAWKGLAALGFGHVEVGTVTPRPQPGNPRPRVFRLAQDEAVINRMGFPGDGAEAVLRRLSSERPFGVVLGVNLGKNKDTPLERAAEDYGALVQRFAGVADYLAVNLSSPNTPGLRDLQHKAALHALLGTLHELRQAEAAKLKRRVPLLVKLSPDLSDEQLDDALDAILTHHLDGIIATNTTLARPDLRSASRAESGGLSGAPLRPLSLDRVAALRRRAGDALPILGVGGVMSPHDARAMLDAGASLVQIYTGMIYQGPTLARDIARAAFS
jgi:dihydroorotate dehydrogenase